MKLNTKILFLFDVDGTLSPSRQKAPEMIINMLNKLRDRVLTGFVGGSDLKKQKEQIGDNVLDIFHYGFPENGVQFYDKGKLKDTSSILEYLGEDAYKKLVNCLFVLLSEVDCPVKRGTFFELRDSMLNVSPVGRSCSQEERKEFFEYDKIHRIREKICEKVTGDFKDRKIKCSIGGEISIDIFPEGWDKTYCLRHIDESIKIYFFGDMTSKGGNDYEIFSHERVIGHTVRGCEDTFRQVNKVLKDLGIEEIN